MRRALALPLAFAFACSSSTSPQRGPLTGTWQLTSATLPTGVKDYRVTLTQVNDTIIGTAVLDLIGDRSLALQVHGRAGLSGSQSCFTVDIQIACHVNFSFQATDASGDLILFQGQFSNGNLLLGDGWSGSGLPFQNVDGLPLRFQRVAK